VYKRKAFCIVGVYSGEVPGGDALNFLKADAAQAKNIEHKDNWRNLREKNPGKFCGDEHRHRFVKISLFTLYIFSSIALVVRKGWYRFIRRQKKKSQNRLKMVPPKKTMQQQMESKQYKLIYKENARG